MPNSPSASIHAWSHADSSLRTRNEPDRLTLLTFDAQIFPWADFLAMESINDTLRMELRPWGIHVVLVAPGSIRTPAVDKLVADSEAMVNTSSPEGRARYAAFYRAFVQSFLKQEEEGVGPEVMAEMVYRALTASTPKKRYPIGPKSRLLPFLGTWLPIGVLDVLRTRLFHVFQPFGSVVERE